MSMPTLQSSINRPPAGFLALGAFFLFGFVMACYAAVTLAKPGTILDRGWQLNPNAHLQLAALGRWVAIPFAALACALLATGIGWFRRRRWAWILGVALIVINLLGDLGQLFVGETLKGVIGVAIAGLVLAFISRRTMREYFAQSKP
jgi:mannose/fructose/N-acetylgalactosamine-specific phosphotransferase system component IIC